MLYRCSPSAFYNVVKKFSNEQKDAICSIGLGSLLQIHEKIHLRHHIIDFVVDHYSPKSGAVIVDNTTVPISLTDMVLCFGLPVVGSQNVLEGNKESIRELCDHYQIKGGYIYKATLEKMLKVDDNGEGFQRTFILYVLCTLFVPHAKQYVSAKYLHTLVDMKTVRKIAWGEFSYSTLVEAICRVKDGKVANVGGFVLFLQILHCDVSTNLDERGNEDNEQPLLVTSEGLPNLASGVKDKHLHHNDLTKLLSKALEQILDLQRIIGAVHSMAIGSAQRLLFLRSDSKEMNMLSSTVAKRVVIDAYMRILDIQQRESGPSHQKRTYYGIVRDRGSIVVGDFFPFIHLTSTSRNKKTRHPSVLLGMVVWEQRKKKTRHPGVLLGMVVWEQRCNGGKHRQHGERRGIASSYDSGVVLVVMVDRGDMLYKIIGKKAL
ncbi:hypothetical protein HHK36_021019 [Tetracentron sinense]|uniref:Aminotransferase-like plant mobile domain-containing protein n=1 Tax=Tetracentron sinense TaxID=13715 RepID=A0A834YW20_TETSI|nr:hypothetical protein HHK36_021019 [Tetracentron sinense]